MKFVTKKICWWFFMSSLIVIYDSLYVLLRAMTMKTGVYGKYFSAYEMYTRYDKLYLKLDDYFLVLHSWFNLFEAALMLLTILLSLSSGNVRRQFVAAILTIFVSAFSLCKTAIYLFYDSGFISEQVRRLEIGAMLVYVLPNIIWLVMPILSILEVSGNIFRCIDNKINSKEQDQRIEMKKLV